MLQSPCVGWGGHPYLEEISWSRREVSQFPWQEPWCVSQPVASQDINSSTCQWRGFPKAGMTLLVTDFSLCRLLPEAAFVSSPDAHTS